MLTLSPGSIEARGRGGAAAKYEPLQCFPRAKTHFSHTVRDVVEAKTCPNSVYTPVLLSLTEISPLYVLQTPIKLYGVKRGQPGKHKNKGVSVGNALLTGVVGQQVFRAPPFHCVWPEPACKAHLIIHDFM